MPLTFPCVYSVLGRREWPAVPLHATSAAYSRTRRSRSPRLRIFETFLAACSVRRARRYGRPLIGTGRIRTSEDQTFLSHRVGLVSLEGCPNVVDEDPTSRARLSLLHQGPFFVDHLLGVRTGEFLDVMALGFGESMGEPEDLGQSVGLLLGRILGRIEFLPHGDDHERQQHGVDDAQDGVDEASHVVVLLAHLRGHKSLHQREPAERGEADRANHQNAIYHADHQRVIPFWAGSLATSTIQAGGRTSKSPAKEARGSNPPRQRRVGPPRCSFRCLSGHPHPQSRVPRMALRLRRWVNKGKRKGRSPTERVGKDPGPW